MLKKLQNFAIKIIDGRARTYDHVTQILKELQWLNVKNQIIYDTGVTMLKYVTNLYPDDILTFPTVGDVTGKHYETTRSLLYP